MRSIFALREWKVPIHISFAFPPISPSMRSFISRAALLVKVTAKIRAEGTPFSISRAIRCVMTRVLPEPAPAKMSMGPPAHSTASFCSGFREGEEESTIALAEGGEITSYCRCSGRRSGISDLGSRISDLGSGIWDCGLCLVPSPGTPTPGPSPCSFLARRGGNSELGTRSSELGVRNSELGSGIGNVVSGLWLLASDACFRGLASLPCRPLEK